MEKLLQCVANLNPLQVSGKVTKIVGLVVEGYCPASTVGTLCEMVPLNGGEPVPAEVVGFRDGRALLMPLGELRGLGPGSLIRVLRDSASLAVGPELPKADSFKALRIAGTRNFRREHPPLHGQGSGSFLPLRASV